MSSYQGDCNDNETAERLRLSKISKQGDSNDNETAERLRLSKISKQVKPCQCQCQCQCQSEKISGALQWVETSHGTMPKDAVRGGTDVGGEPLYVARVDHEGDLLPAKAAPAHGCAFVAWNCEEFRKLNYSVLCSRSSLNWQCDSNGHVPSNALKVGRTSCGEPLYIGRVSHEGTTTVGKIHPSHGCCYIPFYGKEHSYKHYEVLLEC